jgi:hypothetical protein
MSAVRAFCIIQARRPGQLPKLPPNKKAGASVNYDQFMYHREREQHCRSLAQTATDPDVRRRHEELADLHASRAAEYDGITEISGAASSGDQSSGAALA